MRRARTGDTGARALSFRLVAALVVFVFTAVALAPAVYMLVASVRNEAGWSLAAYGAVFDGARTWGLLVRSLGLSLCAAIGATMLGALCAVALRAVGGRLSRVWLGVLMVPLLVPPYINAVAWIDVLGTNGLIENAAKWGGFTLDTGDVFSPPGLVWVWIATLFPIQVAALWVALGRVDARHWEAARLVTGPWRAAWTAAVPAVMPAAVTGGLLVFLLALVGFAVPSLLQVPVYTVEMHSAFELSYDFAAATAQAAPLAVTGGAVLLAWAAYMRPRRAWLSGRHRPMARPALRCRTRALLQAALGAVALVTVGAPLTALALRARPAAAYTQAWETAQDEITMTLITAFAAACVLTVLALLMAHLAQGRRRLRLYFAVSAVPFLLSGPILGVGLIQLWNRPGPMGMVYDSLAIAVMAIVARLLPLAYFAFRAALADVDPQLEEAAAVAGVGWWRRFTGIVLPLIAPVVAAVWGLAFILAFGELDAAVLVMPPGEATLPIRLFTLMHYGPSNTVSALSLMAAGLVLAVGAATAVAAAGLRRGLHLRQ